MSDVALVCVAPGVFRLEGDLDFASVVGLATLPAPLLAEASDDLVIDLGGVGRANSAGLALLLEWLGQARARGRTLRFTNLPDSLLRLAELSNLDNLIAPPGATPALARGRPTSCRAAMAIAASGPPRWPTSGACNSSTRKTS